MGVCCCTPRCGETERQFFFPKQSQGWLKLCINIFTMYFIVHCPVMTPLSCWCARISSFFLTVTSRSLSPFMEKQDNRPLHHTRTVTPIQELPWGSGLKEQLLPSPTLAGPWTAEFPWQKALENVSNQYNSKAADYRREADTMAVTVAADKVTEVRPSTAISDSYLRVEDDEMRCCCCWLTSGWKKGWKNIIQVSDTRCIALPTYSPYKLNF